MEKIPVVLVLDDIRSHHNVGSIFRSCDALGVERLILCGITPRPPHRDIQKTALGSTESVDWEYFDDIGSYLDQPKDGSIVALEQTNASIHMSKGLGSMRARIYLILGNEVSGVSTEALERCAQVWEIPQFGIKKSMNVSVSAGIALYAIRQAWNDTLGS